MMYKVLFKDQYTSGYAKKIAGSGIGRQSFR